MYDTLSTIIPQLGLLGKGFTSNGVPSFSNNLLQHIPISNYKSFPIKSTRNGNNPFSWDDNPTKQKESNSFIVGEDEDMGNLKLQKDEEFLLSIKGEGKVEEEEVVRRNHTRQSRSIRRSNIIAKQVISVESALTLGFVSQLWVDVNSWVVMVVEVKPNLLSGEAERFLIEDIVQVGDVLLVKDESVVENEFKLVGLETLVGYNVVTPTQRKMGKVRGYSFNVDSGVVVLLEVDSFGISIVPSSLVSTYALFTEDILEVGSDTVVVDEAAASRMQRITKGLWDREINEPRKQQPKSKSRRGRRNNTKLRHAEEDDWELPMDY